MAKWSKLGRISLAGEWQTVWFPKSVESYLNVHFDDGFADERCAEKRPERDEEMTTGDTSQVK